MSLFNLFFDCPTTLISTDGGVFEVILYFLHLIEENEAGRSDSESVIRYSAKSSILPFDDNNIDFSSSNVEKDKSLLSNIKVVLKDDKFILLVLVKLSK